MNVYLGSMPLRPRGDVPPVDPTSQPRLKLLNVCSRPPLAWPFEHERIDLSEARVGYDRRSNDTPR